MSKIKFNMIINKCRLAKDGLKDILNIAQDVHYPLMSEINKTILELDKIVVKCRSLREDYE